ncbi:ATP-binding protein [Tindallia californiensis]|uniref:Anti-sigma regulatory factor (Ser/Thr protein kinase) n=1 Tax=Tindallia californiensis TaxID=159292 RepID=A0A1H3NAP3_9FIRM|nr:ATP-binding protein [Tindallia californiensis]SDY85918.1 Anti-sigma regulatory factor (Ser/Thr protein kinase) [Tindallia californiensis]
MIDIQKKYSIERRDFQSAGQVSSSIKKIMKQVGVNPEVIRRVSVASYETEMNIIIHSNGGTMEFVIESDYIMLVALDKGPGIDNLELAMTEGYSTATKDVRELGFGAGMGLPNIKRCADQFEIESEFGKWTKISIRFEH